MKKEKIAHGCNIECSSPNVEIIKGYHDDGWTREECMQDIFIDPEQFAEVED